MLTTCQKYLVTQDEHAWCMLTPSTLELAFFTFTTGNYEKVDFFVVVFMCSLYPGRSGNAMWLKWLGG